MRQRIDASELLVWAVSILMALFLIIVGDAYFIGSRMDMNVEEKLDWISHELSVDRSLVVPPSNITVLPRKEFEQTLVSIYPSLSRWLEVEKAFGVRVAGFYVPPSQAIYISSDTMSNEVLAHELTHHVLRLARFGSRTMTFEEFYAMPSDHAAEESVARGVGQKYWCQSHWSNRVLCKTGLAFWSLA